MSSLFKWLLYHLTNYLLSLLIIFNIFIFYTIINFRCWYKKFSRLNNIVFLFLFIIWHIWHWHGFIYLRQSILSRINSDSFDLCICFFYNLLQIKIRCFQSLISISSLNIYRITPIHIHIPR